MDVFTVKLLTDMVLAYVFQSDVWSMGITAIEMAEGKPRKYWIWDGKYINIVYVIYLNNILWLNHSITILSLCSSERCEPLQGNAHDI